MIDGRIIMAALAALPQMDELANAQYLLDEKIALLDAICVDICISGCCGFSSPKTNVRVTALTEEIEELRKQVHRLRSMNRTTSGTIKFKRYNYHHEEKKVGIKVNVVKEQVRDYYPCIKAHGPSGALVLLDSPTSGVVLAPAVATPSPEDPLGQICLGLRFDDWPRASFNPWSGSITLEQ